MAIEMRGLGELVESGEQDGGWGVIVLATGELGILHCAPVRDIGNRAVAHTAPKVRLLSAPSHEMLPFGLDELVTVTRAKRKSSGEHGVAYGSNGSIIFAPFVSTMTTAVDMARSNAVDVSELEIGEPGVISSLRVEYGTHDRVRVWNRGALAGELVLKQGDADAVAELLAGAMCKDRIRAIDALREARDDFSRAQQRCIDMLETKAPTVEDWRFFVTELIAELGDCASAANLHAQFIEDRITKAILSPNEVRA